MALGGPPARRHACDVAGKPWRCRLGRHDYVRQHPADERLQGPASQVCRRCGKGRNLDDGKVPPIVFG